jgi:hypothetical protein
VKVYYWLTTQRTTMGTTVTQTYVGWHYVFEHDVDLLAYAFDRNTGYGLTDPEAPAVVAFGYQPADLRSPDDTVNA